MAREIGRTTFTLNYFSDTLLIPASKRADSFWGAVSSVWDGDADNPHEKPFALALARDMRLGVSNFAAALSGDVS